MHDQHGDFAAVMAGLARMLTERHGVQVVVGQGEARLEPADGITGSKPRLVIPSPEESLDPEQRRVLVGQLDLLAARAIHLDSASFIGLRHGFERRLAETIDEARAIRLLARTYAGASWYLRGWREFNSQQVSRKWNGLSWSDKLLYLIQQQVWQAVLPGGSDSSDSAPVLSLQPSPSLSSALSVAADLIGSAAASRSGAESRDCAVQIMQRIRQLAAGRVNNMMVSSDASEGFDPDGEFEPGLDFVSDGSIAEESGDADAETSTEGPPPAGTSSSGHAAQSVASETATVDGADVEGADNPAIDAAATLAFASKPLLSVPLSTAFDTITDVTGQGDRSAWHALRSEARLQTGSLKTRLERALRADELTHWKREQERGEIDRVALLRLASAPGYRTPFKVKRVTRGRDTAVTVLLDLSGSMAGRKIALAQLCAAALGDALLQLDFACEILGYSSIESAGMRDLHTREIAAGTDLRAYNRLRERLDLWIYKRFDSVDLVGISSVKCGHENPDGECLSWAAARLAAQPAERRILMVLSDGYPATGDGHPVILRTDLHARIETITANGIELVGIGILDDAVETFYPNAAVVRRLDELPSVALTVLGTMLLGPRPGARTRVTKSYS